MKREVLCRQLAVAKRHVKRGRDLIARQEALIAELDPDGHNVTSAISFLDILRDIKRLHQQFIESILAGMAKGNRRIS